MQILRTAALTLLALLVAASSSPALAARRPSVVDLYRTNGPAVFEIRTEVGALTGVFVDGAGTFVTSAAIDKAAHATVVLKSGYRGEGVEVLAVDPVLGLAVGRADVGETPSVEFAKRSVIVGQTVYAISFSGGFDAKIAKGLVTTVPRLNRTRVIRIEMSTESLVSGRPVFNRYGGLVGFTVVEMEDTSVYAIEHRSISRLLAEPRTPRTLKPTDFWKMGKIRVEGRPLSVEEQLKLRHASRVLELSVGLIAANQMNDCAMIIRESLKAPELRGCVKTGFEPLLRMFALTLDADLPDGTHRVTIPYTALRSGMRQRFFVIIERPLEKPAKKKKRQGPIRQTRFRGAI